MINRGRNTPPTDDRIKLLQECISRALKAEKASNKEVIALFLGGLMDSLENSGAAPSDVDFLLRGVYEEYCKRYNGGLEMKEAQERWELGPKVKE